MRNVLIGMFLGVFLSGVGIASVRAEEHTKQYQEWRDKATKGLQLSTRCLETKKGIKLLADNTEKKYGKNMESLESISNHIEWLHMAFIILERDTGAKGLSQIKMSDIPGGATASFNEPTRWFADGLLKAMEPLDDLAHLTDKTLKEIKTISSAKLGNIKLLHVIVENIKNGGDFRKAIGTVKAFEGKLGSK